MPLPSPLSDLPHDALHALRLLRRDLGFTAVVVLSLAAGIGANSAIFALVDAVILRELPVRNPRELVIVGDPSRVNSMGEDTSPRTDLISYPLYADLRDQARTVTGLLASGRTGRLDAVLDAAGANGTSGARASSGTAGPAEHPRGRYVSANYFSVLGVPAAHGRVFDGTEDRADGAAPIAVISDGFWERRFARSREAMGRTITLNGAAVTIVGVTPPGFDGEIVGQATDLWLPLSLQPVLTPHRPLLRARSADFLLLIGRLAPGKTVAAAREEIGSIERRAFVEHGIDGNAVSEADAWKLEILVSPGARGTSSARTRYEAPLAALMAGVGLLLLIICANVANLLLARAVTRAHEMSVRLALGAPRARLVRQLLTESVVLAAMGLGAGLLVALWGSRLLLSLANEGGTQVTVAAGLSAPVLLFTLAVSATAVLLFGLAPALSATRVDLAASIRAHAKSLAGRSRGGRIRSASWLVSAQVALSLVLLMGAALLVGHLRSILAADPGLDRDHLLIAEVDAQRAGYTGARLDALVTALQMRLGALPGVRAASYSENGVFSGTESANTIQVPEFTPRAPGDSVSRYDQVGPGYASTLGARLVAGRDIEARDAPGAQNVMLVNETFAKFYFAGASALGRAVRLDSVTAEIVGVIADTRDHDLTSPRVRRFYLAYRQHPLGEPGVLRFEVRTAGNPAALVAQVRRAVAAENPLLSLNGLYPLAVAMSGSVRTERLLARLATGFGVTALVLCALGLYGVLTYSVTRRRGEIGLRMALGAARRDIVRLVIGDAGRVVAVGAVVGVPLALAAERLLRASLSGLAPSDQSALAVAAAVLAVAALVAALVPALRASRVEPAVALRGE